MELDADELYNKGVILRKTGNPKESISYFNRVLEINPNHLDALLNKGHALGRLGKYHDAITCYEKVLQIDNENILALINIGLSYHYLHSYESAVSYYDKILEKNPNHANALYHKACTKALQKNYNDALDLLEHAVKLDIANKIKAKGDLDFDNLRDSERFIKLTARWEN